MKTATPEDAGRPMTREELKLSLEAAMTTELPLSEWETIPEWLLDWAERQDARRVWSMWSWHNAITCMQSALIRRAENQSAEAGMVWIYNHLEGPGMLPDSGDATAQEWFDKTHVPIKAMVEISELSAKKKADKSTT